MIDTHTTGDSLKFKGLGFERVRSQAVTTQRASTTSMAGDVRFTVTDGDIVSRGSDLNAARDLVLNASRDIKLLAAVQEVINERSGFSVDYGATGLRSMAYQEERWNAFTTELSQTAAGRNLIMTAGRDVIGEAAAVMAGEDLTITAGRDVVFDAVQNEKFTEAWGWTLSVDVFGADLINALIDGDLEAARGALVSMTPMAQTVLALRAAEDGWDVGAALMQGGIEAYNLASAFDSGGQEGLLSSVSGGWSEAFDDKEGGGPTISFSADLWKQNDRWTETFFSMLSAGGQLL